VAEPQVAQALFDELPSPEVESKVEAKPKAKKSPKRPIEIGVHVHDRTQVETVFDYYLRRGQSAAEKLQDATNLRYRVDAYLFYPRQFALNEHTYPKERFFADIRPLLRFREPKFSYKCMLGAKTVTNAGGEVSVANSPWFILAITSAASNNS